MRLSPHGFESRREFFCGIARWGGLVIIGAAAAAIQLGRKPSGQRCNNRGICSGCLQISKCGLPQARSAKQFLKS
jgi:hypothetical protein